MLYQLPQCGARTRMRRIEAVDFRVAIVGEDQALLGVEHGQPLGHVLQRHVEIGLLLLELGQGQV